MELSELVGTDLFSQARYLEALQLISDSLGPGAEAEVLGRAITVLSNHGRPGEPEAYRRFFIRKKSGGKREIVAPEEPIKGVLRLVSRELLCRYPLTRFAHGFRTRRSAITNAGAHLRLNPRYGMNWDIANCFPSTNEEMIRKAYMATFGDDLLREGKDRDLTRKAVDILILLTTLRHARAKCGVLPQGAPTSPALLNLVLRPFDLRLAKALGRLEDRCGQTFVYTRYGDDITVTSKQPLPGEMETLVPNLLRSFGYEANKKKTKKMERGGSLPPIEITGLILGDGVLRLSDAWIRRAELQIMGFARDPNPTEGRFRTVRGKLGLAKKIYGGDLPGRLLGALSALRESSDPKLRWRAGMLLYGKKNGGAESQEDADEPQEDIAEPQGSYGNQRGKGQTSLPEEYPSDADEPGGFADPHNYDGPDYTDPATT